jgi:HEAT repeat protein
MSLFGPPNVDRLKAKGNVAGLIGALRYQKDSGASPRAASRALGEIRDPRAVEPLIAALREDKVRRDAVEALGQIGDARAVKPLVAALSDLDWSVREVAGEALAHIGPPAAGFLIAILNDQSQSTGVRWAAAKALGKIGDPRAVEPLIAALSEGKVWWCRDAVEALGQIGDARAVEPLVIALNSRIVSVRKAAAEALDRLAWSPDRKEAGAAYWAARGKWDRCVDIGVPAVEPLVAALRDGPSVATAEALGKIGDPRAVEPLVAVMRRILSHPTNEDDWLQERDGEVCRAAAKALGRIGDARAVAPLIAAVESGRAGVGHVAAEALVQIGAPAVEPLIAALNEGKLFHEAAKALGQIGDPRAVEPLIAALNEGKAVSSAVAEALGQIGDPRAVEPLVIALNNPMRGFLRGAAAEALDRLAWSPGRNEAGAAYWAARRKWDRCVDIGVPAVEPLIATLRWDPLGWAAAAEALVQIGAPAVEPLVAALKDPEKRVRDAAAATLERMGVPRDQEPGHGPRDLQDRMEESQMKLGTSRVYAGPLLYGLYEGMDSKSRESFKNFVASASPQHEFTATFPPMPAEVAQSYLAQLQHAPKGKNSVLGATGNESGYIFWSTGDSRDALLQLAGVFKNIADEAGVDATILFGSPTTDQLKELP